jgi:hypothetical protein
MKTTLLLICLAFITACDQVSQNPRASQTQVKADFAAAQNPSSPPHSGPQPTEVEMRAAIQRTYADAVIVDHTNARPFIVGDFNGDDSEDIAIVVKPRNEKLSELNSEYVNWILEDPHHIQQIARGVRAKETLLVVIHGRERAGWRNDLARQTYLLKNAVGTEFASESRSQLRTSGEARALPQLHGDVIREKLNGSAGIIYWNGGKYAWHPLT